MANTRETMGEQACLDALLDDTLTEFEDDSITRVSNFRLAYRGSLERVILPNATSFNESSFNSDTSLIEVYAPKVTQVGGSVFNSDKSLEAVTLGDVQTVSSSAFYRCRSLSSLDIGSPRYFNSSAFFECWALGSDAIDFSKTVNVANNAFENSGIGRVALPNVTVFYGDAFRGTRLSILDLGSSVSTTSSGNLVGQNLANCKSLCHLVLRKEDGVCGASVIITGTPISQGVGWLYVPDEMVDTYKENSGWSSFATQIVGISEYLKPLQDETIQDSWSTIVASTTYATDYPIGSVKYLDVDGTQVAMTLVAVDTDDLASGGKARMTWISRDILMNMSLSETTTIDINWQNSPMRSYLREVVFPKITPVVRNAIQEVSKTYYFYDGGYETRSGTDTIWVPSVREVGGTTSFESSGCDYAGFFTDNTKRVKHYGISGNAVAWRTRTQANNTALNCFTATGALSNVGHYSSSGLVFGFCI